jgi:hypothetical protein
VIYSRKGERLTCENDHLIGVFTCDLPRGEVFHVDMVEWSCSAPRDGDPMRNCPHCGAFWVKAGECWPEAAFRVEGEWRL